MSNETVAKAVINFEVRASSSGVTTAYIPEFLDKDKEWKPIHPSKCTCGGGVPRSWINAEVLSVCNAFDWNAAQAIAWSFMAKQDLPFTARVRITPVKIEWDIKATSYEHDAVNISHHDQAKLTEKADIEASEEEQNTEQAAELEKRAKWRIDSELW